MQWAAAIVEAIQQCQVMVLVFSEHANKSEQIMREVERAIHKGIPILPFRIADVLPTGSMEYFLATPHWLDALTPPLEEHLARLAETVPMLLARNHSPLLLIFPLLLLLCILSITPFRLITCPGR